MERVQGYGPLIECINPYIPKYIIRWDIKEVIHKIKIGKNKQKEKKAYECCEQSICHKPTIEEIKEIVLAGVNEDIDKSIKEGFVWKDMSVWLSTENQFNYKAAYDLAIQTQGASLPVIFKFGTVNEPKYYTFSELSDLTDFYTQAMGYINKQLVLGWGKKDSINWNDYEDCLKSV